MKEKAFFLFFCMIFVGQSVFCQQKPSWVTKNTPAQAFTSSGLGIKYAVDSRSNIKKLYYGVAIIQPNYYTQNFGFFCKKEWEFEKLVNVPLKLRLGSVQYCDWMEGKTQYR